MAVSAYVVAAMCGCWKRESGVNPGVWESLTPTSWDHQYQYDGIGGFGLGQWTNVGTPYGRCYNLHVWVTEHGYADGDGNGQIAFITAEQYWTAENSVMGYSTLDEFLASDSANIPLLVEEYLACWEGVPGDAYSERVEAAQRFIDVILAHASDDPDSYSWISGNFYSSWDQMDNNVMCAFFALNGYVPQTHPGNVNGFIEWCIDKCNDPDVGYSQTYRDEQTIDGITYYDCSSFVWYGLYHNEFDTDATGLTSPFTTDTMPDALEAMGWVRVDINGTWEQGDILVGDGHTEVVYSGGEGQGVTMGAHSDTLPLADQVSINNYTSYASEYLYLYRFTGAGPTPGPPTQRGKFKWWLYLKRIL